MSRLSFLRTSLHPFLFAAFPPLFLYARNLETVSRGELIPPLLLEAALTLGVWAVLYRIRSARRALPILFSLFWIGFFLYGPCERNILLILEKNPGLARPLLFFLWWTAYGLMVFFLIRSKRDLGSLNAAFTAAGAVLVGLQLLRLLGGWIAAPASPSPDHIHRFPAPARIGHPGYRPSIFFLVADAYGRADALQTGYGFDAGPTLREWEAMGFKVLPRARANYSQTVPSLASCLNGEYIQRLLPGPVCSRAGVTHLLKYNALFPALRSLGYRIAVIPSGYGPTEIPSDEQIPVPVVQLTEFQSTLCNYTPLPWITTFIPVFDQYDLHRKRLNRTFDSLKDLARRPGPWFVFVHILFPHAPFVYDAKGRSVDPPYAFSLNDDPQSMGFPGHSVEEFRAAYIAGYRAQLPAANLRLTQTLKGILHNAPEPPVIFLLADHGPSGRYDPRSLENTFLDERFGILWAYYAPPRFPLHYPDDSTPVNLFRRLLSDGFGFPTPPLENREYFSTWESPCELEEVTDRLP